MISKIRGILFLAIGLAFTLTIAGGTAYGQCGTRGHKPCVKRHAKAATKRKVARRRHRRNHSARIATVLLSIPPRDPNRFTMVSSDPPSYRGPVTTSGEAGNSIPRQISGGVLNGKAIILPAPKYPPAARAVGASGPVSVQVLIDENGDVVSASAVSGNPLLRGACVEAARGTKFAPTMLMGQPVKVSGVITYNFVP